MTKKNLILNSILFLIAIISAYFFCDVVFAINIDIPFSAGDVGLKDYSGADSHTGARSDGTTNINNVIIAIIEWFRRILGVIATVWIVWQGYIMLTSHGDDSKYTSAQKSIMWGVVALIVSFLVEPFVRNVIYGGGDILTPGQAVLDPETSTSRGILELQGFMKWIKTMIGILAVGMIIFTGIQAMLALDKDDEINKQKTNIKWIIIGIIIIIFNDILINYGVYGDPRINKATGKVITSRDAMRVIMEMSGFVVWVLSFFAAAAIGAITYGGYLILTSAIDESQAEKGKNIIKDVIFGFIIAVVSYTLVRTVIFLQA